MKKDVRMRSIFREKSIEFFDILKTDRSDWPVFWKKYCRVNKEFMNGYLKKHDLDHEKSIGYLNGFSRPFLDSLRQENESIREIKRDTVRNLARIGNELKLKESDFSLYLISALGIEDVTIVENIDGKGYIVLIDIVSLKKNGKIDELSDIAVFSAKKVRDIIDNGIKEEN